VGVQRTFADFRVSEVTISSGGTLSTALDMTGHSYVAIEIPSTFTGTVVSFKASISADGTFYPVYDQDGSEVLATVKSAGGTFVQNYHQLCMLRHLKLGSGPATAAVTQTADVTIKVLMK